MLGKSNNILLPVKQKAYILIGIFLINAKIGVLISLPLYHPQKQAHKPKQHVMRVVELGLEEVTAQAIEEDRCPSATERPYQAGRDKRDIGCPGYKAAAD